MNGPASTCGPQGSSQQPGWAELRKQSRNHHLEAEGYFHSSRNRLLGGNWSTAADDAIDHADVSVSIRLQLESGRRELATANSDPNTNSSFPGFRLACE